jgi:hypothetical protein
VNLILGLLFLLTAVAPLVTGTKPQNAEKPAIVEQRDRATGLLVAPGFEEVKARCLRCHSATLIVQTRGRREDWIGLIRWMQATQELEVIPADEETKILDYLEANYGLGEARYRRRPLPDDLLPPATDASLQGPRREPVP